VNCPETGVSPPPKEIDTTTGPVVLAAVGIFVAGAMFKLGADWKRAQDALRQPRTKNPWEREPPCQ
jgi:hypothetical protein